MARLVAKAYGWSLQDAVMYLTLQCYLESNQACLEPNNTFRVGVPKRPELQRLVGEV